jgi:hypothetical protein
MVKHQGQQEKTDNPAQPGERSAEFSSRMRHASDIVFVCDEFNSLGPDYTPWSLLKIQGFHE